MLFGFSNRLLDDVLSRARESRLSSLRAEAESATNQQEMIELFWEESAKTDGKIRGLEEENRTLAAEREELENKVDRLEYENSIFQKRAASADDLDAKLRAQIDVVRNLATIPKTLSDVIKLVSGIYSDRIYFTERALKSASGYIIDVQVAWDCIRSVATVLHDLSFTHDLTAREIVQQYKAKTGYDLALFESETTKNNKKLAALRQDRFERQTIDITSHVKHRNGKPNLLRVHFFRHTEKKLLIVGHCGDHLETMKTN